jgi:hypothetical protein
MKRAPPVSGYARRQISDIGLLLFVRIARSYGLMDGVRVGSDSSSTVTAIVKRCDGNAGVGGLF